MSEKPPSGVNSDASVNGLEANFTDIDGIRTRYYEYGSDNDEPMVLLHGGSWEGTASANTWSRNIRGLSEEFHVFAPDRIGNGMTDNPPEEEDYVYQTEVDHMIDFLKTMGILDKGMHLVGQSRGGGLSGRIAVEFPGKTRSLNVANSNTLAPTWADYNYRRNNIMRGEPTDTESETYYEDSLKYRQKVYNYTDHFLTEESLKTLAWMRQRPKAKKTADVMANGMRDVWYRSINDAMKETRNRIRDGELTAPTHLIWGRNDMTSDVNAGLTLYNMISQKNHRVRFYLVDKAGHGVYKEVPEEFNNIVTTCIRNWETETSREWLEAVENQFQDYDGEGGAPSWNQTKDRQD